MLLDIAVETRMTERKNEIVLLDLVKYTIKQYGKAHAKLRSYERGGSRQEIFEARENFDRVRLEFEELSSKIYIESLPAIEQDRYSIDRQILSIEEVSQISSTVKAKDIRNWIERDIIKQNNPRPGTGRGYVFSAAEAFEIVVTAGMAHLIGPSNANDVAQKLKERFRGVYTLSLDKASFYGIARPITVDRRQSHRCIATVDHLDGEWRCSVIEAAELYTVNETMFHVIEIDRITIHILNALIAKLGPHTDPAIAT